MSGGCFPCTSKPPIALKCHQLKLRPRTRIKDRQTLPANDIDLRRHDSNAEERNGGLDKHHLGVNLEYAEARGAVEGAPCRHEERSLGKAELRLGDGEGEGRVEGDDGVHVGGEEGCLDAREGRGCREEDEEREEGGASGNGEDAECEEGEREGVVALGGAQRVIGEVREVEEEVADEHGEEERGLLGEGDDDGGEYEGSDALFEGDETRGAWG